MNLSVCTISFRHQLISLEQIAQWATRNGFRGIELWGVHARNLASFPQYDRSWLESYGLSVPMVSDYLPIGGELHAAVEKAEQICRLAQFWGAAKVRTFAGDRGSASVARDERCAWVRRMRELCERAWDHGIALAVETHPNTLADTHASTLQLVEEVDHPALGFNFDVIHVWEGGADPREVFLDLESRVLHLHLKNVVSPDLLSVFAPNNVYSPAGSRLGMVNLFQGAFDYERFLRFIMSRVEHWDRLEASLEWFGPDVLSTLSRDCRQLHELESRFVVEERPASAAVRLA